MASLLPGRMLPGDGGRAWAGAAFTEPGGKEDAGRGVPGKCGKDLEGSQSREGADDLALGLAGERALRIPDVRWKGTFSLSLLWPVVPWTVLLRAEPSGGVTKSLGRSTGFLECAAL